jgi:hypothetical protein
LELLSLEGHEVVFGAIEHGLVIQKHAHGHHGLERTNAMLSTLWATPG